MRLGGRLQAAIEVLDDIEKNSRPAAEALKDWGASHRFAGAGDRAVIANIVYDALRRKLSLSWRMQDSSAYHLAYGALLTESHSSAEEVLAGITTDKFAPVPLSQDSLNHWTNSDLKNAPEHIQADVPLWCVDLLRNTFGDDWVEQCAALAGRPPLDLRVNLLKADAGKVLNALADTGVAAAPFLNDAVRIPPIEAFGRHPNLQNGEAFLNGWFEVQDLGSQIAAKFAAPQRGDQVLDYCAGAGGKTLAMAAAMQNSGQIHAYDAERSRLSPMNERLQRAGVRNTQAYGTVEELEALKERMDLVLTDAPCTGSGTWRRRPDAKWRLTEQQLEKREEDQRSVLDAAKQYVKTGGRLVYVTCSLFDSENQRQIERFLSENPTFTEESPSEIWSKVTAGQEQQGVRKPVYTSHGCAFSPLQTDTDGFYVCVLKKTS